LHLSSPLPLFLLRLLSVLLVNLSLSILLLLQRLSDVCIVDHPRRQGQGPVLLLRLLDLEPAGHVIGRFTTNISLPCARLALLGRPFSEERLAPIKFRKRQRPIKRVLLVLHDRLGLCSFRLP